MGKKPLDRETKKTKPVKKQTIATRQRPRQQRGDKEKGGAGNQRRASEHLIPSSSNRKERMGRGEERRRGIVTYIYIYIYMTVSKTGKTSSRPGHTIPTSHLQHNRVQMGGSFPRHREAHTESTKLEQRGPGTTACRRRVQATGSPSGPTSPHPRNAQG